MLLILIKSGVNFINVFLRSFLGTSGGQKRKKDSEVVNLFTLSGTTCVKAVRRTLMKLSPGVNFINILYTAFTLVDPKSAKKINNLTVFYAFGIYEHKS